MLDVMPITAPDAGSTDILNADDLRFLKITPSPDNLRSVLHDSVDIFCQNTYALKICYSLTLNLTMIVLQIKAKSYFQRVFT